MVRYLGLTVFVQRTAHNLLSYTSSNRKPNPLRWQTVDLVSSRFNYIEEKQNFVALRTNGSVKCTIFSKRNVHTQWKDASCCSMNKSDKLFSSFSDSRDKGLCLPHCGSHICVAAFEFLPLLEASLCVQIAGERTLFNIPQVAPKPAKAWSRLPERDGCEFGHDSAKVGIEFACITGRFAVRITDLVGLWVADQRIILQLASFPFLPQRYFIKWSQYFINKGPRISHQIAT